MARRTKASKKTQAVAEAAALADWQSLNLFERSEFSEKSQSRAPNQHARSLVAAGFIKIDGCDGYVGYIGYRYRFTYTNWGRLVATIGRAHDRETIEGAETAEEMLGAMSLEQRASVKRLAGGDKVDPYWWRVCIGMGVADESTPELNDFGRDVFALMEGSKR